MSAFPLTIAAATEALRARTLTSVELVEGAICRAEALDGRLGVYIARFDEAARRQAAQADAELDARMDRGPLHGIPIGIKDILAVSEGPTTAQSVVLDRNWGKDKDAIVVERLKAAGAILTGKLTTMEFAFGLPDPDRPFPLPRNPWNADAWPGGSSSGAAAGVAGGLFLAGIGTDTGGSIRIPAAFSGVSGLKPTYGRVPTAGCVPVAYSLDHVGPLARSARDCWTVLAAIAGPDPRDPGAVDRLLPAAPAQHGSLAKLRIGVEREHHLDQDGEDAAVAPAFEEALQTLESLGATLVEVTLPLHDEAMTAAMVTCTCEALAYHYPDVRDRLGDYARSNRSMLPLGACFSGADYVQAQRVRQVAQRALAELFGRVDLIAMPAASRVAPSYERLLEGGWIEAVGGVHTMYWNAVGNPALVVPMGFNADGLPLSLQLAARPFAEDALVKAGDAYQDATDWHLRLPPLTEEPAAAR